MRKLNSSDNLSHPLTDLAISLMVIFVLLLVIYLNNTSHAVASIRSQLLKDLSKKLGSIQSLKVERDPKDPLSIVIIVPQDLLGFGLNDFRVPVKGKLFLKRVVPQIATIVCNPQFEDKIDSINVIGYTDSNGVHGMSKNYSNNFNLRLSQDRSMSVVEQSLESLKTHKNNYNCFLKRLSASGKGDRDPIMINGKEDFAKSRRVVFKIRILSTEQQQFQKSIEKILPTQSLNR